MIIASDDMLLQDILRDLKGFSSKKLLKAVFENPQESRREWLLEMMSREGKKNSNNERYQLWQQHNQPILLDKADIFEQKLNYIHDNPVKEEIVCNSEDYLYSSARDYAGGRGLVDIAYC